MKKEICVLHEYGAPTHYIALRVLAERKGYKISYYTFENILSKKLKYLLIHPLKAIRDICFLLTLPYKDPLKIVVGIAPYNNHLPLLMKLMRRHDVYYHTSYSCWDGSRFAHKPDSDEVIAIWKGFTNKYVKHIFVVSELTQKQLIVNGFSEKGKISIVNHSYEKLIHVDDRQIKTLNFISVAGLTEQKGIPQLLELFSKHSEASISFVGRGPLKSLVIEYAKKYPNIEYLGYINGSENIMPVYRQKSFLILNSMRTEKWEELFGMVIIEGMSCGCVPITTNHPGPKEIIDNGIDGIICQEGEISNGIEAAIKMSNEEYLKFRQAALNKGKRYHCELMADKWQEIFA